MFINLLMRRKNVQNSVFQGEVWEDKLHTYSILFELIVESLMIQFTAMSNLQMH